jgi:hypothetical protein
MSYKRYLISDKTLIVPATELGVHPSNRGSLGVIWQRVDHFTQKIKSAEFDLDRILLACQVPAPELHSFIDFNQKLKKKFMGEASSQFTNDEEKCQPRLALITGNHRVTSLKLCQFDSKVSIRLLSDLAYTDHHLREELNKEDGDVMKNSICEQLSQICPIFNIVVSNIGRTSRLDIVELNNERDRFEFAEIEDIELSPDFPKSSKCFKLLFFVANLVSQIKVYEDAEATQKNSYSKRGSLVNQVVMKKTPNDDTSAVDDPIAKIISKRSKNINKVCVRVMFKINFNF